MSHYHMSHQNRTYSWEEYLKLEAESELRYEFHDGEVFCMAGGTNRHNEITGGAYLRLRIQASKKGCKSFYLRCQTLSIPKHKILLSRLHSHLQSPGPANPKRHSQPADCRRSALQNYPGPRPQPQTERISQTAFSQTLSPDRTNSLRGAALLPQ